MSAAAREEIERQLTLEDEGAKAYRCGIPKCKCPYDQQTQPSEWNHWVYGYDNAKGHTA